MRATGSLRDPLLVLLAVGAGAVDAITLTALGVFTAAITGNVVLLGIALGTGNPHVAVRSGSAFLGFALGVYGGARLLPEHAAGEGPSHRRRTFVLAAIACVQAGFLALWLAAGGQPGGVETNLLVGASALAMGAQTATARSWRSGITTTYMSGTLTLLLSDLATTRAQSRTDRLLRAGVIVAVAAGAAAGALLLAHVRRGAPLLPLALTLLVAVGAAVLGPRAPRAS